LAQAKEEQDHGALVTVCNELGGFYRAFSRYAEGIPLYEQALASLETLGMKNSEAHGTTLLNFATTLSIVGRYEDALDAYTFSQINAGNAVSLPFAKGFGWGGEKNLEYIFEKLYCEEPGLGYPRERAAVMAKNREVLNSVKAVSYREFTDILKEIDQDLVKGAFAGANFKELFFANCKCEKIAAVVKEILGE
jgi:tetratricopeptide (TPR) repeat protein